MFVCSATFASVPQAIRPPQKPARSDPAAVLSVIVVLVPASENRPNTCCVLAVVATAPIPASALGSTPSTARLPSSFVFVDPAPTENAEPTEWYDTELSTRTPALPVTSTAMPRPSWKLEPATNDSLAAGNSP